MNFVPHAYQKIAIDKIFSTPRCGLFLDMGLGKTVITLTAIEDLIYNRFEIDRALVIAPLRVAERTWSEECRKWDHLKHLRISKVLGTPTARRKALAKEADIYIINRENTEWLVNELSGLGDSWVFDMVVIDELSSFKSASSRRFRALRKYTPRCERVIGLTGTPAPNGLIDLWSQIYLLDGGTRLGKTITGYRQRYFLPDKRNATTIFSYKPKAEAEGSIKSAISDICISMNAADWLEMPEVIRNLRVVTFSEEARKNYDQFERDSYLAFLEGEVTAVSTEALINKLLQFSNGAMYKENGGYVETSDAKLQELDSIISEANGQPVLCYYSYRHDCERIMRHFKGSRKLESEKEIEDWNEGKIPLLLAHPASAGHGINLQYGGHIMVWFGLPWSLELYQQANARLARQGQKQAVIIHHILTDGTMDARVYASLQAKSDIQEDLLAALKVKYQGVKK